MTTSNSLEVIYTYTQVNQLAFLLSHLKKFSYCISKLLLVSFEMSFTRNSGLANGNKSRVVPIHKKDNNTNISLL